MADDGMNEEERKAYEAARRLIAKVKREGGTEIGFYDDIFHRLTKIPDEIADIPGLFLLDLMETEIADLRPIEGQTELRKL